MSAFKYTGWFISKTFFFLGLVIAMTSFLTPQTDTFSDTSKTVVIMLGPPGSGKGTQAAKLSREVSIPHISTGDLFRENIAQGTELGKEAKAYIEAGKLSPDELVLGMLFDRISKSDCSKGFLLDGFPRTIPQAEIFDRHIEGKAKLLVINLRATDESVIKRIAGRQTCKGCGSIYNLYFSPAQIEGKCDRCNGELFQRPDDSAETVQERLRVYHEQTKPLIERYQAKGVLITLDGETPAETIAKELSEIYHKKQEA